MNTKGYSISKKIIEIIYFKQYLIKLKKHFNLK